MAGYRDKGHFTVKNLVLQFYNKENDIDPKILNLVHVCILARVTCIIDRRVLLSISTVLFLSHSLTEMKRLTNIHVQT